MSDSNIAPVNSRREFLSGRALRDELEHAASQVGQQLLPEAPLVPEAGTTIRLGKTAMACNFDVILNPGSGHQLAAASEALDLVDRLEDQMTVYRPHSELSDINRLAAEQPAAVEPQLFELLCRAERLSLDTEGAFDPTSGPLVALWRACKREGRLPDQSEIDRALGCVGFQHVHFHHTDKTLSYDQAGIELNLGSIGKGYALDRAADILDDAQVSDWLLHGGHSSLLARGTHAGWSGWPVGLRNPLFPQRLLGTLLLKNRGMSTSGSGVQFFRHQGQRYGHLLDPRTGWPVEDMLSVTVLAPTAAEADALSTAFYVLGVEKSREYCHNHSDVAALFLLPPRGGSRLEPINCGLPEEDLFFTPEISTPATG